MKLLRVEIENFGTLSSFTYDLNEGVNVLLQGNGWGKTTLSVFIKAMLYGLPATSRQKIEENERKHYQPWQQGRYGGSLTLERGGKTYRIERFFGKKESEDIFSVIDLETHRETDALGPVPGETLFGINAEGFEKSVFLSQKEVNRVLRDKESLNDSLNAKINRLSDAVHDLADYENAAGILDKRIKFFKTTGDRGEIPDLSRRINERTKEHEILLKKAEELAVIDTGIATAEEERRNTLALQVEADKCVTAAAGVRETRARMTALNQMLDRLGDKEKDLKSRLEKIGGTLPGEGELESARRDIESLRNAENDAKRAVLTETDRSRLNELTEICRPFADEQGRMKLAQLRDRDANRLRLLGEMSSIKNATEGEMAERQRMLKTGFPKEIPPQEVFDELIDLLPENNKKSKIALSANKKSIVLPILIVCSCLLLAGGGVAFSLKRWWVGGACILLCAILAGVCRWISVKRAAAREAALLAAWGELTSRWEISPERTREAVTALAQNASELLRLQVSAAGQMGRLEEIRGQLSALEETMQADLPETDAPWTDLTDRVHELEGGVREYSMLTERNVKLESEKRVAEKTAAETRSALTAFLRKYAFPGQDPERELTALVLACHEIASLSHDLDGDRDAMLRYAEEAGLEPVRCETLPPDTYDEATEKATQIRVRTKEYDEILSELRFKAEPLRAEVETIESKSAEIAALNEEKEKAEKDQKTVSTAYDFLARAKENLTLRYLHKMQGSLQNYLARLSGRSGLILELTPELDVRIREGATGYAAVYYSAGWQDLIRFCMRLSLCEALFEEECPPLILDDPFVNLDDRIQPQARAMLDEVGEKHQILYLTCHSSRV